jgi:hypothetical protein
MNFVVRYSTDGAGCRADLIRPRGNPAIQSGPMDTLPRRAY